MVGPQAVIPRTSAQYCSAKPHAAVGPPCSEVARFTQIVNAAFVRPWPAAIGPYIAASAMRCSVARAKTILPMAARAKANGSTRRGPNASITGPPKVLKMTETVPRKPK